MQVHVRRRNGEKWSLRGQQNAAPAQLTLAFSSPRLLADSRTWEELRSLYPQADIVGCSTAGEIDNTEVLDDSIVCTALSFDHSTHLVAKARHCETPDSASLGSLLATRLPQENLTHVLVLCDGLKINGSTFLQSLAAALPQGVAITGGLAGDGPRFVDTAVCVNGPTPTDHVVAIGLYGSRLSIGYGSAGGWDAFGVERQITRSEGNRLYELDGKPALDLYKRYLGPFAKDLPASGLRFPLAIRRGLEDEQAPVVRTILAVDEASRSLTFAGEVPRGYRARLMSANLERLLDGASTAASLSVQAFTQNQPQLAILISCVGRRLVLDQRVEEEVEAVRDRLGPSPLLCGFYSYGEISPFQSGRSSEFHNQTMTITTLGEQ